jgi:hypothetical protein
MFQKHLQGMPYFQHLKRNFLVAFYCLELSVFQLGYCVLHFMHGIFPCRYTDHHFWQNRTTETTNEQQDVFDDNEFRAFIRTDFAECWQTMNEIRRRNNTGLFVQIFNREPTETEIKTGEIQ